MRITKKILSLVLVIAMVASFAAMSGFEASAASATGRTTTDFGFAFSNNKFKILQLADIQTTANDSNIAQITKDTIRLGIERYAPDLIILTGDQTQGSANESQWKSACDKVLATITDAGFPLSKVAVTMGNHDPQATGISLDNQQAYYVSKGCIDFDNNFSSINLVGGGTGCIPIKASSSDSSIAFNVTLFDSGGNGSSGGYECIGCDHTINGPNYTNIVNWYTNMNNTLAESSYKKVHNIASGTNAAGYKNYLVPTLCAQHIILQEVYTTGGLEACASGTPNSVGANDTYNPNGAAAYKLSSTKAVTGKLGETPCCTGSHSSTANQYHAVTDPGNCVGFAFGHDHDNSFEFTDDNGLRFFATSGLSKEVYLTDGNPGVRYFDLTLDPTTGDVSVASANKKYTDLTAGESVSINSGRIEALDDNGEQEVNTISCPQIIYVGGEGNDLTTQNFGTRIQSHLINYDSRTLYEQDLDVKIVIPADATNWDLKAYSNGSQIGWQNTAWGSNANGSYYVCTLDSTANAAPNLPIQYEVTYDIPGQTQQQKIYGASFVENIKMPSGYATWQRYYAGDNKNKEAGWVELNYVAVLSGTNVFSTGRWAGSGDGYNSSGYFNYSSNGELDAGFVAMNDTRYSVWWWSPARARDSALVGLVGRNVGADATPKSTIYVNKDSCPVVASNDRRYLLGPKLSIWNAHDSDNGWEAYLAGLGFVAGDTGCNPEDYRAAMASEATTFANANAESTGNFAYTSYAANEGLNGVSSTHVNGNTTAANKVGAGYANKLVVPLTSQAADSFPADGTNMTMLTGMRVKGNSNNYAIMVYAVEPYYLEFKVYDKAQLRMIITQELEAARQSTDFPYANSTEWNVYVTKLKAAQTLYARVDTNQAALDTAYTELNAAVVTLINSNTQKDETIVNNMGTNKASTINVPHVIYVSASIGQKNAAGTILTSSSWDINGDGDTADANETVSLPRTISFQVPSGSTSVACQVITGAAGANNLTDVTNTNVSVSGSLSGTTWTGSVNSGTATDGGAIYYKLSYVKGGVTYVQYAASYVKAMNFFRTASWRFRVINTDWDDSGLSYKGRMTANSALGAEGLSTIMSVYSTGDGITGQGKAFESSCYNADSFTQNGSSYGTNYNGNNTNYSDAGEATLFNDRGRTNKEDWGGTTNGVNGFGEVQQWVVCHFYYDQNYATSIQSIPTQLTFWKIPYSDTYNSGYDDHYIFFQRNYYDANISRGETKADGKDGNPQIGTIDGANNLNTALTTDYARITTQFKTPATGMPASQTGMTLSFRKKQDDKCWTYLGYAFDYQPVDRINAHSAVDMAITHNYAPQYMTTEWWNTYRQRVLKCYTSIGNLWDTTLNAQSSSGYTDLKASIDTPKYVPADYTSIFNAVNACTNAGLSASKHCVTNDNYTNLTYKVPTGDDSRYVGKMFGPTMFENDATDLVTVLRNRSSVYSAGASETANNFAAYMLDFRYQQSINDYAATITAAAATIRLKPADYSYIDRYTNYYNATNHTIFFDTSNNAGYNNAAADRAFTNGDAGTTWSEYVFTNSTVTALANACSGIDRTLKKPSESAAIDSMARLYPASYTYKNGVASPDTTVCKYNALRDAYEGLVLRRAAEYYSSNGSWTDNNETTTEEDDVTYYANYNKAVVGGGTYVYTPVFSVTAGTASSTFISKGGYGASLSACANAYNGGVNTAYNVLNGDGTTASTITRFTAGTWGAATGLYGFKDVYGEVFGTSSQYATTNAADKYVLAIYAQSQILPAVAKVDRYKDLLVENDAVKTGLTAQLGSYAAYENNSSINTKYTGKIFETGDTAYTTPLDTNGRAWYTGTTWDAYSGAKTSGTTVNNNTTLKAAQQAQVNTATTSIFQKRNALVARKLSDYNSKYITTSAKYDFASLNSYFSDENTRINDSVTCYTIKNGALDTSTKRNYYTDAQISAWNTAYTAYTAIAGNPNAELGAVINNYTSTIAPCHTQSAASWNNRSVADYSAVLALLNGTNGMRAAYDIGGSGYTAGMGTVTGFGETPVTKGGTTYNTTGATWYRNNADAAYGSWEYYVAKRNAAVANTAQGGTTYNYDTTYTAGTALTAAAQWTLNNAAMAMKDAIDHLTVKTLNWYSNSDHKFNGQSAYAAINESAATWNTNINAVTTRYSLTGSALVENGTINNYVDTTRNAWNLWYSNPGSVANQQYLTNLKTNGATYTLPAYYDKYISVVDSLNSTFNSKTETTADYSALLTLVNGSTVSNVNWRAPYDIDGSSWRDAMRTVTGFGETAVTKGDTTYNSTGKTWYVGGAATTSGTWDFYAAKRNAAIAYTSQGGTTYSYATTYTAGTGKAAATQANINAAVKALFDARGALTPKKLDTYSNSAHKFNGKTDYAAINADAATWNTNINATTARYTIASGLVKTGTINNYAAATITAWNTWYANPDNVASQQSLTHLTANGATNNLGDYFDKYISVVDSLNTTYTNRAEQTADYAALLKLVNGTDGWRAAYDINGESYTAGMKAATGFETAVTIGSDTYNTTGKTWYTTTTWNDYAAKRNTASALTSQAGNYAYATNYTAGAGKVMATQATINTAVENLYNSRNALALKKLNEYSNTNAWLGSKTTFADINTLAATYDTEINGTSPLYTVGSTFATNGTIFNYQSATRTAWNNPYDTNAQNLANLKTNGATYTLADYYDDYQSVIGSLKTAYNAKAAQPADYSALVALVNGSTVSSTNWKPGYDIGGANYTAAMRDAAGFDTAVTFGGTTYNTTGAAWYTPATWSAFVAKRNAGIDTLLGSAAGTNTYAYGTTYAGTAAGTVLAKQAAINAAAQNLYNARAALAAKKLSDYSVSAGSAWYSKTNYADINAQAATYNTEIANKTGAVTTVTASPSQTPPYSPNTVNIGSATRQYYATTFVNSMGSAYASLTTFTTNNADADLATSFSGYRSSLAAIKALYDAKATSTNLNAADYSYLAALLNRSWIPKYDTNGSYNYNGTGYTIGSQYSGANWYTATTWNAYNTARNAAAQASSTGANYNVGTGYGNQYGAGSLKMDNQASINTLVNNLGKAYYDLQFKSVADFDGTWNGATGYINVSAKVSEMTNGLDATTTVWSNFAGSGSSITYTETQVSLYDSAAVATIMAQRSALLGTLTATTAGVNASTNINSTDVLAEKYNAYLAQLAAYKTAVDGCVKNNANYTELIKQIGVWAEYDGYWVSGSSVIGGSNYTYALSRESGMAGTSNGSTWYTSATWTPYSTARNAATNLTAQAANFNYGSTYTNGAAKLDSQTAINTAAKNLYAARQDLALRPLSEYNVSWTAAQNGTAYANYAAMKTFVNTASNFSWVNGTVSVIESFTGTTANTATKSSYTPAAVNAVATSKAAAAAYCDDAHKLVDCLNFRAALNGINTTYTNNNDSYNDVYQTGWNWIFAQLTAKSGTVGAVNESTLSTYLTKMCNVDLSTTKTTGGASIATTLADKASFITRMPKAIAINQNDMNTYVTNLYNELINTTAVSTQVVSATAAAQAKAAATVNAYDPMQLNSRTKVTSLTKYTAASVAALNTVISSVGTYTLWTATPAALGYNASGSIIDGTEATNIWKAAGLTSAKGTAYAENTSTNSAYKLVISAASLAPLNDALSYAKTALYVNPTAATLVQKTTVAHQPAGATYTYNTFTTASANELIAAIAAVNTSGLNVTNQATIDQWVHDLIDQTDIANTVKIENADGGLYGTLASAANNNGLKYNAAYYNYLSTEISTIKSSSVSSLIWDANSNIIMDGETAKGAYYYTTNTWNAYAAALANAKADSGKNAAQQAAIDALATSLYNARNALTFKTLNQSSSYEAAQALVARAEAIYNLSITKVTYANNTTSATREEVTCAAFPDDSVETLQNNMAPFITAYITNAATVSITDEAEMSALIVQYNDDMDGIEAEPKIITADSEFAEGTQALLEDFVAGTYTRRGSTSTFTSEELPTGIANVIKLKIDAIYALLESGVKATDANHDDVTNIQQLGVLTDDLYTYCTGTRAKDAKFAVDAKNYLTDFLSLSISSMVGDDGSIYAEDKPLFDEDYSSSVIAMIEDYFSTDANWPYIYQVDDTVFNVDDYSFNVDNHAYEGGVPAICAIFDQVGGMSDNYIYSITDMTNYYMTGIAGWFKDNTIFTNGNTTYVLASPSYELLGDYDGSLTYDVNANGNWYTEGRGSTINGSAYYVMSSPTNHIGSNRGGWFTDNSANYVDEYLDYLNSALIDSLGIETIDETPRFGYGVEATEAMNMIIADGWTPESGEEFYNAICNEQGSLDTAVSDYFWAISSLELLQATDAYREVLALIYAANGQTPVFNNNNATLTPSSVTNNPLGGRIYNNELLGVLGAGNYSALQADGYYYSTQLPNGYDQTGSNSISGIMTYFNGLTKLTIDRASEVTGSATSSAKSQIITKLRALQIGLADFTSITELAAAFLDNNDELSQDGGLGLFDIEDGDIGTAFFTTHSNLGRTGNAYAYRNNELMASSDDFHASGFYTYDKYTSVSLANVVSFMKENGILSSNTTVTIFNTAFDNSIYGSMYTLPKTQQSAVDDIYRNFVTQLNNLVLQPADKETLEEALTESNQIVLDEDYYDTEDDTWQAFLDAKTEADALRSASIIDQAAVAAAEEALQNAIAALVVYIDEYAPVLTMHNEMSDIKSFCSEHPELGISQNDAVTGTFVQPNYLGYTMYIYTNKLNPKFVVTLQDTTASGDRTVKASKPEKMAVQGMSTSGATAAVITPVLDEDGTLSTATTTTLSSSITASSETPKAASGKYDANSNAYMVLSPTFSDTKGTQQAVKYVIDGTDSAQDKKTGTVLNNAAGSVMFSSSDTDLENEATNGKITVMIYYLNDMAADGTDEGYDTETGTVKGATTLEEHEYSHANNSEKWIAAEYLYRIFDSKVKNWEFVSPVAGNTSGVPLYNDPNFGTSDFGSFAYVINPDASTGSFDYYIAKEFYASGSAAAKAKAIELLKNTTYANYFKNTAMKTDRYMPYGAGTNWSKPISHLPNGTLIYVHVLDRFGNVCNRIVEVDNVDTAGPSVTSENNGSVTVSETGGSGIFNMDIFTYMGTQGSSLYSEYHLNTYKLSGQNSWVSEDNNFRIQNLVAGNTYTIAATDTAGNVGSCNVKADTNGEIVITADASYTKFTYNTDNAPIISNVGDGEENELMTFTLNGEDTIILNYGSLSSIVKAGPDGNVFANNAKVPLNIIAQANVTSLKVTDRDTGAESIWTADNATKVTNEDGTVTWTMKQSFTEGDHNFTAVAMVDGEWEAFPVDFKFTATTKSITLKFITIGLGRTVLTYNNGNRSTFSTATQKTVPYGSNVKLVSSPSVEGSEFLYWQNNQTTRITGTSNVMEFTAVTDMDLTVQFTTAEICNGNKLIIYTNEAGNVVDDYFEIPQGGDYTVPAGPTLPEHVFKNWSMTKEEILASEKMCIIVKPVYSLVVTNTVEITAGNYTATGAGTYSSSADERAIVNINASATDNNGAAFLYWRDAQTGDIVTYSRAYSFFCIKDTVLTPVYGDASGAVPAPVVRISTVKYDSDSQKVNFYAERSVPAEFEIYQTGVIVTKTGTIGESEKEFVIGAAGVGKGTSNSTASNGFYTGAVKATSGSIVYARAYIIYENASGEIATIYSPISSYTVE